MTGDASSGICRSVDKFIRYHFFIVTLKTEIASLFRKKILITGTMGIVAGCTISFLNGIMD
jgi:hypothetical protein